MFIFLNFLFKFTSIKFDKPYKRVHRAEILENIYNFQRNIVDKLKRTNNSSRIFYILKMTREIFLNCCRHRIKINSFHCIINSVTNNSSSVSTQHNINDHRAYQRRNNNNIKLWEFIIKIIKTFVLGDPYKVSFPLSATVRMNPTTDRLHRQWCIDNLVPRSGLPCRSARRHIQNCIPEFLTS